MTKSSARRERCVAIAAQREEIVEREVAVADGVEAVCRDAREAEIARDSFAIDTEAVAGERAGAHRASVGAVGGMLKARYVARKSFGVREQKMREQDRLSVLHVRHAGHRHAEIGLCLLENYGQEFGDLTLKACRGVDHEEAKIGRDKFVAAAAGVQLPSERAEFMDQCAFNEMMDVFSGRAVEKRWIVVEFRTRSRRAL